MPQAPCIVQGCPSTLGDIALLTDAAIREAVTMMAGAPVRFQPMLDDLRANDLGPDGRCMCRPCGATEPPVSLTRSFYEQASAEITHAYGAIETSPLVTINRYKPSARAGPSDDEL